MLEAEKILQNPKGDAEERSIEEVLELVHKASGHSWADMSVSERLDSQSSFTQNIPGGSSMLDAVLDGVGMRHLLDRGTVESTEFQDRVVKAGSSLQALVKVNADLEIVENNIKKTAKEIEELQRAVAEDPHDQQRAYKLRVSEQRMAGIEAKRHNLGARRVKLAAKAQRRYVELTRFVADERREENLSGWMKSSDESEEMPVDIQNDAVSFVRNILNLDLNSGMSMNRALEEKLDLASDYVSRIPAARVKQIASVGAFAELYKKVATLPESARELVELVHKRGGKRNLWAKANVIVAEKRGKKKASPFDFANMMKLRMQAAQEARKEKEAREEREKREFEERRMRELAAEKAELREQIQEVRRSLGNIEGEFGPTLQWTKYGPDSYAIQLPSGAGHWHMTQNKLLVIRGASKPFPGICSIAPVQTESEIEAREVELARLRKMRDLYETGDRVDKDVLTTRRLENLNWRDGTWGQRNGSLDWLAHHVLDRNKAQLAASTLDLSAVAPEELTPRTLENQHVGSHANKVPKTLATVIEKSTAQK